MELIMIVIMFVFGIIFGSFFNVVGYRLPIGESLLYPSSHCPKCNHKLSYFELFPIFSYIFQLGKCKKCKNKISLIYPVVEFITGILFVFSYLIFGYNIEMIISLIFVSAMIIIIISDIRYMIISDEVLIISGVLIFIFKIYHGGINIIPDILIDMVIPFVFMLLIKLFGDFVFKKESMGGGDIKLMILFGLVLGFELSIVSIFISTILALPISLIALIKKNEHMLPFGPYLAVAALIIHFFKIDFIEILRFIS